VIGEKDEDSLQEAGIFQAAARLRRRADLPEYEKEVLLEIRDWFNENLNRPTRFSNSRRPERKKSKAISWFKSTALEHLDKARQMMQILRNHDIQTRVIKTRRPGYIVYEDADQIVAEPFHDEK
jgi:hypothetical protein